MTIDEYIKEQDEAIQPLLNTVRDLLRATLPECEEKISWGMPTYFYKHNIIHFAPAKKHLGIYPGGEAVSIFEERLKEMKFKYSKGAIQIPYNRELPVEFLKELALWCFENNQ